MDFSTFEIKLRPLSTEEEVVNHILDPKAKIDQGNVTNVQELLKIKGGSGAGLRSIKDNLERIRVSKGRWLDKLKSVLDKELFQPRGWIDLLSKNEAIADLLRKRGNEYFVKRNFDEAFRAYTLAAMYSPKDSKSLALAYSNRSACFAETKNWNRCLEDIERFEEIWNRIEAGFTLTGDKVAKRKERCLKEIGDKKEDISIEKQFGSTYFKLKNPSTVLPSLEDFLGVKTDPKKGRGIYNISENAIEPGTLLVLDQSYSHVPRFSFSFDTDNCSACLRTLYGSGIPCGGCVFNLYCSEACATSDYHNIHAKYECKLAPYLFEVIPKSEKSESGCDTHLALSILLKLGPQALLNHYRQIFNKVGDKEIDEGSFSAYLPMYNLVYHEEILCENKLLENSKYAVVLTEILDFCTDYFTCLDLDELEVKLLKEEFARRLLLHQLCMRVNANKIGYSRATFQHGYMHQLRMTDLGLGVFPAVSLINHSCAPNARWFALPGGVMAIIALEYIVPGQEVLAVYADNWESKAREDRREGIMELFGFTCECPACTGNWTNETSIESSTEVGRGCICPNCRKKFDVINEPLLLCLPSKQLFICPRKCGFQIHGDDLLTNFNCIARLAQTVPKSVDENKMLKAYMDVKKCVKFLDSYFPKPNKQISLDVDMWGVIISLIAGKMFE